MGILCALILGASVSERGIRIFLIGDSTMADKPLVDNPEHGWGQMLPLFFSDDVQIFNHARNGRSTRSFLLEGRWQKVYEQLRPGDYVFIQFGHNDAKSDDTARFAPPRPDYRNNLRRFIKDASDKRAVPILLTPITRRQFDKDGRYVETHGEYPAVVKEIAAEEHVPMIDMFEMSMKLVSLLGDERSKKLYLAGVRPNDFRLWNKKKDDTHFTRGGAITMASLVVDRMKQLELPLAQSLVGPVSQPLVGDGKVVGLDYYFNNEWRQKKDSVSERWHYTWEDTTNGGFSFLGRTIDLLGADLDTMQGPPTAESLKRLGIYIIVDPDTPAESPHPHEITEESIRTLVQWVEQGGVLVLLGNDKGNMEFEHLNNLAERFGIHFNEDSYHKVTGDMFEGGRNKDLPEHPIFRNVKQIFATGVCSLRLNKPAEPILTENGVVLMAASRFGKGVVFACGDPWLYNEYTDGRKLPPEYENAKAGRNLFHWLLGIAQIHEK